MKKMSGREKLPEAYGGLVLQHLFLPQHFNQYCYGFIPNIGDDHEKTMDTHYCTLINFGGRIQRGS